MPYIFFITSGPVLLQDLSPSCPKFIATQSPLPVTLIDFWCMMYEQGVEVLVTLSSENEVGKVCNLATQKCLCCLSHSLVSGVWFICKGQKYL